MKLPSTRYTGSKRKVVKWIWENIRDLKFDTALDAFSGTSTIGYFLKLQGKEVTCNDVLKHNFVVAKAIVENRGTRLNDSDIKMILTKKENIEYPKFIQETFKDIYYTDEENAWLDMVITNIKQLDDEYKKALAFYALFQACLVKRPFNLFHRKNLYVRFADVKRSFGNKKTWDKPFAEHFRKFVSEANSLVFDSRKNNKALNLDALEIKNKYDLVYIDTPYFSAHAKSVVDYYQFYHFLEGLLDYDNWENMIDKKSKHKRLIPKPCIWNDKNRINEAFDKLFERFKDSIIVVSYRTGGIPTEEDMTSLLKRQKQDVKVIKKQYKYVLSNGNGNKEVLFIAK